MQINFRQGIVSHQTGGFLQVNGSGHIDLLAANKPVTVSLAHRDTNYAHSEDNTVASAWSGPFTPSTSYYLYWEFNQLTFERIFNKTLLEPVAQSVAPGAGNSPIVGVVPGIASPAFGSFEVEGHYVLPANKPFSVVNSTANDGSYTVQTATYSLGTGNTTIVVNEAISDTTIDGELTLDLDYNGEPLYVDGRTWFDTTNNIHYKLVSTTWVEILRVYAAQVYNSTFISLGQTGNFTGTQIGNNNTVASGRVLFGETGDPIRRDNSTFFTTEDQFFTNQSRVDALRLESNVSRAQSDTGGTMAAFGIVAWTGEGKITPAQYDDTGTTVVGVLTETLNTGEVGAVIVQGTVTNQTFSPPWSWSTVGAKLWITNGALTETDPHVADPVTYPTPHVPVARVLSSDTIIFEQGLGGVGPQGARGEAETQPFADDGVFGITSITPAPATNTPVAIGENHPIITGWPYSSLTHQHTADEITVTPVGDISNNILQNVIGELDAEKLSLAGGIMTGVLVLDADPINILEAATKQYVDTTIGTLPTHVTDDTVHMDINQNTFLDGLVLTGSPIPLTFNDVNQLVGITGNVQAQLDDKVSLSDADDAIYLTINAQTGTSYTLVLTDDNDMVTMDNVAANIVTIPANASVAFPIGTQIIVSQEGAGQTTFAGSGSPAVTLNSTGGLLSLTEQYSTASLIKKATDTWLIAGNLA